MRFRFLILLLIATACTKKTVTSDSLLSYLPKDAAVIIKTTDLASLRSELRNSEFLDKAEALERYQNIKAKLKPFEQVAPKGNSVFALYEIGKNKFELVFVTEKTPEWITLDQIVDKRVETLTYEGATITQYSYGGSTLYAILMDGNIVVSSSKLLIENQVRAKSSSVPQNLQRLYDISSQNKTTSLFINLEKTEGLLGFLGGQARAVGNYTLGDWLAIDLSASQRDFGFNGVAVANDSTQNFINLFKGTKPLPHNAPSIAPDNTEKLISFTFDDYGVYFNNQKRLLDHTKVMDTLFSTIEEVGVLRINGQKAVSLHSYGANSLYEYLVGIRTGSSVYQNSEISELGDSTILNDGFGPLIGPFESRFVTLVENTFVFSDSREVLQTLIANFKSGATFDKTPKYQHAMARLADQSSVLAIADNKGISELLNTRFQQQLGRDFAKADYKGFVFMAQLVADTDFYHTSFHASEVRIESKGNAVSPLFTTELDADLANDPQFVLNHRSKKQEIVVQDVDNTLYLLSTEGKVLWKKALDGPIQGRIQQVDLYKNGKLQLAFCTLNKFMILDRNGEVVAPFDMKFDGGNLNELAVFDYENNRNYRFLVTQGRRVFMYNGQGSVVNGFTYTEAESDILAAPKHFRMGNKDFLVFKLADKSLKIKHRAGNDRIKVDRKIDFSENEVFMYRNKFSVTDTKGVLHQVDSKGKLSATDFNLVADHGMYATSKTLALMNENTLSIKGKKVALELGVYTAPKIFYIYDKIYVAVTDLQSQRIFLYDSQAKPIANFPVFGNSIIDMADIDNDKRLELVAKDQGNSIIVYRLN
ncbi:MAG: ribonuclease HII [Flavobacteriaceae bacterium]|nr:ribonuclease HII [Flavobacteriaceae bacterium]